MSKYELFCPNCGEPIYFKHKPRQKSILYTHCHECDREVRLEAVKVGYMGVTQTLHRMEFKK